MRWRVGMAVALLGAGVGAGVGAGCGGNADSQGAAPGGLDGTVTVFAASSLTDAFDDLARAFEDEHPGVVVEVSFAGSSGLARQIAEGAPAEVFASADALSMDRVVDSGDITVPPVEFVRNEMQIAVPDGNPGGVAGLDDLGRGDLLVGLCAEEVPCGRLGREVLANAEVTPAVDTEEPDVRALLTKVEAGDLDVGLVYRSDVQAVDGVEGIEIPAAVNVAATYPIAPIATSGNVEGGRAFIDLVLSEAGQRVLADHGFLPVP